MKDIRSLTYEQLKEELVAAGEKPFRADQVFSWLHEKKADDFSLMTDISKDLRGRLSKQYEIYTVKPVKVLESKIDGTRKYIQRLSDGNVIESVLMKYEYGNTVCISSQVGCRMGCRFCASTLDGLVRGLTAGEMAGQVYAVEADIGERVGHVVVMGSGEPLDNYDEFCNFLRIITHPKGAGISARCITASTCGLADKIRQLADEHFAITLALSLHAVTNEKRRDIMPIANKYELSDVIDACRYYFDATGRRITLEYSLIAGVNDTSEDAEGLIGIAASLGAHVNLIPVNPIKERKYRETSRKYVDLIKNKLEKNKINVTIRREMGRDINASCGQLRRAFLKEEDAGEANV